MPETMWWLTWQCRSDDRVTDFGMDRGPEDTEVLPARICRGPGREGVIGVGTIEGFSIDVADPVRSRLGEDLGGFAEWLPGDEILAGGRVVPIDLLGGNEILPRLAALRRTGIVPFQREGRPSDGGTGQGASADDERPAARKTTALQVLPRHYDLLLWRRERTDGQTQPFNCWNSVDARAVARASQDVRTHDVEPQDQRAVMAQERVPERSTHAESHLDSTNDSDRIGYVTRR